ncbi:MAG: TAXI family TRAP transporter solute-binding subunit [Gammaproteobacteria bacterium]|nr:MAG: TAXI family TRAP transporter solute-binding subunit [Gammaproteobacteria bacterium]
MLRFRDEDGHLEYLWIFGPAVLLGFIALLITYQFVDPAPPDRITIATGGPQGAYYAFGQRYREILARDGVTLEVLETDGSVQNIELLESPDAGVDVAFVQGGTGGYARGDTLESLASVYYEPLWVFVNESESFASPSDIIGKRISIGPEGSGTRALVLELSRDSGIDDSALVISDLTGKAAVDALRTGSLDMVMLVASPESELVQELLRTGGVRLLGFARAEAYTRRHRYLSKLTLPEGAIDLSENLPPNDVGLLAPTANLVAKEDLHPALVDLLLQAADEVHGGGGLFEQPGAFPSPRFVVFPLGEEARRYFTSGPPFLRRTLPFWAATLIDRLAVMLLPLIAIIIPLMRIMPPIYKWRVRRRVYKWYKQLRKLEGKIQEGVHDDDVAEFHSELERIDTEVTKVQIPWAYAEELYQLRLHIRYVREGLDKQPTTTGGAARRSEAMQARAVKSSALEDAS